MYSIEGSIRNISTMKLTLRDIVLMDIGDPTYTSFDWNEDIVNYKMDHPESEDWIMGHIHSHNSMKVFFSTTDMEELNDNSPNHNFYLSVIINNYLDICAKVAFIGNPTSFICKNELGKDYTISFYGGVELKPVMFIHDCEIHMTVPAIVGSSDFEERLRVIQEKSEARKVDKVKEYSYSNQANDKTSYGSNNAWDNGKHKAKTPGFNLKEYNKSKFTIEKEEDLEDMSVEEEFACYILRFGYEVEEESLEDAVEDLANSPMEQEAIVATILNSYTSWFEIFFRRIKKYHTTEAFLDILYEVCVLLEDCEDTGNPNFSFIPTLVAGLRSMGNKIEDSSSEEEGGKEKWG